MPAIGQREPRIENRRLLDLAHRVQFCVNCKRYLAHGCEPAHSNLQRHGRGENSKSHDQHHAALCHDCHVWYDYGTRTDPTGIWQATKEDKAQFFVVMQDRTMDIYWREDWIEVPKR
jgi:hypothetical protein